jgi:hypothetical protein
MLFLKVYIYILVLCGEDVRCKERERERDKKKKKGMLPILFWPFVSPLFGLLLVLLLTHTHLLALY